MNERGRRRRGFLATLASLFALRPEANSPKATAAPGPASGSPPPAGPEGDGGTVVYRASGLPAGLSIDATAGIIHGAVGFDHPETPRLGGAG